MAYDTEFFNTIDEGCRKSAETVVPMFLEHYKPKTVVDVGCGQGWWGKSFEDAGCEVTGIEFYTEPVIKNKKKDLLKSFSDVGNFDLAVCLEVAEHLPPSRANGFINELCELSDTVLFSAAIPGQGGTGHLNEQWPDYWLSKFTANGYASTGALRWLLWNDERVENWYRQNLIVTTKQPQLMPELFDSLPSFILPVVHPVLYNARRKQ